MDNLTQQPNEEQKDLLLDVDTEQQYEYASQGQRFLNWLIDNLFVNYAVGYATGFGIGFLLGQLAPDFLLKVVNEQETGDKSFVFFSFVYLVGFINYMLYYTLSEKLFKGYTLGKLITGTRALRQDGQELTVKNSLLRSLTRCVPFEAFSGFGTLTWHDSWTDTMVIKSR